MRFLYVLWQRTFLKQTQAKLLFSQLYSDILLYPNISFPHLSLTQNYSSLYKYYLYHHCSALYSVQKQQQHSSS